MWQRKSGTMRPSTGFISVIIALQICRNVSLFGLTDDPCQPFHYYGEPKATCTKAIPRSRPRTMSRSIGSRRSTRSTPAGTGRAGKIKGWLRALPARRPRRRRGTIERFTRVELYPAAEVGR